MKTKIIRLEEIDSTNRYLKNYREEGDEEMIVAVADYQADGKGQGTHTWESEKGKTCFSVSRCILIGFLCVASLSCLWLVLLLSRMHWILMWRTSH